PLLSAAIYFMRRGKGNGLIGLHLTRLCTCVRYRCLSLPYEAQCSKITCHKKSTESEEERMSEQTIIVEKNVGVPMHDGVVLRADIYRPAAAGTYPVLLQRTPYNKNLNVISA